MLHVFKKMPFFNVKNGDFWNMDFDEGAVATTNHQTTCVKITFNVDLMKLKLTFVVICVNLNYEQQQKS